MTAKLPEAPQLKGENTIHFHDVSDFHEMVKPANLVAARSFFPRRYQWRAYFFSCLQNTLLCLPTGMGKTLIASMLMKAYHQLNPKQAQIFIVPTVILVRKTSLFQIVLSVISRLLSIMKRSNNKPNPSNAILDCKS